MRLSYKRLRRLSFLPLYSIIPEGETNWGGQAVCPLKGQCVCPRCLFFTTIEGSTKTTEEVKTEQKTKAVKVSVLEEVKVSVPVASLFNY
eukprot:11429504-Prorocentrum_lima.AAC.1